MKLRHLYLSVAILGTAIPLYHFIDFLLENGLNAPLFLEQMFANDIASFFSWDVIISTLALITFIVVEGKRIGMGNRWLYILFNLTVGVSLALPAFLYAREIALENTE